MKLWAGLSSCPKNSSPLSFYLLPPFLLFFLFHTQAGAMRRRRGRKKAYWLPCLPNCVHSVGVVGGWVPDPLFIRPAVCLFLGYYMSGNWDYSFFLFSFHDPQSNSSFFLPCTLYRVMYYYYTFDPFLHLLSDPPSLSPFAPSSLSFPPWSNEMVVLGVVLGSIFGLSSSPSCLSLHLMQRERIPWERQWGENKKEKEEVKRLLISSSLSHTQTKFNTFPLSTREIRADTSLLTFPYGMTQQSHQGGLTLFDCLLASLTTFLPCRMRVGHLLLPLFLHSPECRRRGKEGGRGFPPRYWRHFSPVHSPGHPGMEGGGGTAGLHFFVDLPIREGGREGRTGRIRNNYGMRPRMEKEDLYFRGCLHVPVDSGDNNECSMKHGGGDITT